MDLDRATKKQQFAGALSGITADVDLVSGVVHAVTLRDANGGLLRIERNSDYESLKAFVPAKPKLVKRWQLSGKFKGLDVSERFDHKHDAEQRRQDLEGWNEDEYQLSIAEVESPEEG